MDDDNDGEGNYATTNISTTATMAMQTTAQASTISFIVSADP